MKYILSAVSACPTALTTTPLVVGAEAATSHAVSQAYTGKPTVRVGKFASALIVHCNKIVHAFQSVPVLTTIPKSPLASPSAPLAAFASTASRLLSVGSRYTRSQNACVYHDVPVIVTPLHLPSAERLQSSWRDAFSSRTVAQDNVLLLSVCVASVPTIVVVASGKVIVTLLLILLGTVMVILFVQLSVSSKRAIFAGQELFPLKFTVPVHFL